MVRAKFKVMSKEITLSYGGSDENGKAIMNELVTVKMNPVTAYNADKTEENKSFWKYSPSGELRLGTINKKVADFLELNGEYYLDFTKAE